MADESGLERTEPASQRRLDQARRDGDIPRSRELATCVLLLAAGGAFWFLGGSVVESAAALMRTGLSIDRAVATDASAALARLRTLASAAMVELVLIGGLLMLAAVAGPVAVGGWMFSAKGFTPQASRISPMKGFGRMFSANSLVELLKAIAKVALVGCVAYFALRGQVDQLLGLSAEPVLQAGRHLGAMLLQSYFTIVGALVVIAAIDAPYQLWHYANRLKMTRQELREEAKETEGRPEIKAKIRSIQRALARRRMMADVPTADVVVTNPTHYAVALKYAEDSMGAPRVVAKGTDAVAARIRELAAAHGVVLLEAPPLARALHKHADIGDEIPPALYSAVAEVLAYVFQLRTHRTGRGARPVPPSALEVPAGMDPLEQNRETGGGGS